MEVVIVASAFGVDSVRQTGHAAWLDATAAAGAAGFEVRRELFVDDAQALPPALEALGAQAEARGLWCVYSTPATVYDDGGRLDDAALAAAQAEADALGARFVKLQLGAFAGNAEAPRMAAALAGGRARLLVENGQCPTGGTLAQFTTWFDALASEGGAALAGMTFDIGNWLWTGEVPLDAAHVLGPRVEYIHCKGVAGSGARRHAAAPSHDDPFLAEIFSVLPRTVARGIEFPFAKTNLAADAKRQVAWLSNT